MAKGTVAKIERVATEEFGENVVAQIVGKKLILEIDLAHEIGPSSSGKTTMVAKSGGIDSKFKFAGETFTVNCNIYKK